MPAEDTSTDYVFRIIYPGHKHDNSKCLCSALFGKKTTKNQKLKTKSDIWENGEVISWEVPAGDKPHFCKGKKNQTSDKFHWEIIGINRYILGFLNAVRLVILVEMELRWESCIYSVFYRGSFQNTPLGLQTETESKKIAWLAKSSFAPEVRIFLLATMLAHNVVIRKKTQL